MLDWFDGVAGPDYVRAIVWTLLALVVLVIVLVIVKLIRSMTFGTFVAGGRNRKTRLAVMDATAVDSHRRLVLVRRDDIEHLLLIGGPTDVVVERDIRLAAPRRPTLTGGGQETAPARKPGHAQVAPPASAPAAPPRHPARAATPPAPPPYPRATAGVSPPAKDGAEAGARRGRHRQYVRQRTRSLAGRFLDPRHARAAKTGAGFAGRRNGQASRRTGKPQALGCIDIQVWSAAHKKGRSRP